MSAFGSLTVSLVSFTDGAKDEFGKAELVEHPVDWVGVLMRPYSGSEENLLTNVASEVWRVTGPPSVAALAATAAGVLRVGGVSYPISKVEPFPDLSGDVHHVRVTCYLEAS